MPFGGRSTLRIVPTVVVPVAMRATRNSSGVRIGSAPSKTGETVDEVRAAERREAEEGRPDVGTATPAAGL